jgi:hypothetical protein
MTEDELFDAIDGLMAYDLHAIDSGIYDEALRERVRTELHGISQRDAETAVIHGSLTGSSIHGEITVAGHSSAFNQLMARFIERHFLGPKAMANGHGYSDLREFIQWMDDEMEIV